MLYIKTNNISFCYETQSENILEDVSFEMVNSSRVGLIGNNGCGKTTILKMLKEEIQPISGNIYFRKDLVSGFLPQEIDLSENISVSDFLWKVNPILFELKRKMKNLQDFSEQEVVQIYSDFEKNRGYKFEYRFEKTLSQFELEEEMLTRPLSSLSGGEKTKIAFCRIMLNEPDILLLDEPTNHLDIKTLNWLESYLQKISIPFLVISHDRRFLDYCVKEIWELEIKTRHTYSGNYSFYKYEKATEFNRKMHRFEVQQKKIKQLKKTLSQRKTWAFSHQSQTGKEGYAPVYEKITNPAKSAMKRAKNIETRIRKEIEKEESSKPFIEKKRKIQIHDSDLKSRFILKVENLGKSFDANNVFKSLFFSVPNHSRLVINGVNGSGKTTLLKILIGEITDFDGSFSWNPQAKIGYYSQEFENLNENNSIIEEVIQGNNEIHSEARTILGCLNIRKDKVYQKIRSLSIGEKSKTALAKIIVSDANVLLLEEPTNHLEISAREALENALIKFNGTIIFVSHDRYLQEKLSSETLELGKP